MTAVVPMYACIYYVLCMYEYMYIAMRHQDRLFSCKLSLYFHDTQNLFTNLISPL